MTLAALRKLIDPGPAGAPPPAVLLVDDTELPVVFKRNAKARRIILRMNPKGEGIVLTVPPGTTQQEALAFANSQKRAWIAARLKRTPDTIAFAMAFSCPCAVSCTFVSHRPECRAARSGVKEAMVTMMCRPFACPDASSILPRRLKDWLKAQARADLTAASEYYAQEMGLKYSRLSIRDQSSRWGSCSSTGALSYSWRLILGT